MIVRRSRGKKCDNEAILFFIFNKCPWKRTHFGRQRRNSRQSCLGPMAGDNVFSCQTQHGRSATHGNVNGWPAAVRQLGTPSKLFNFQRSVRPLPPTPCDENGRFSVLHLEFYFRGKERRFGSRVSFIIPRGNQGFCARSA